VRCQVRDLYPLSSSRTTTPEGFLVAPAKINRTGIQVYTARELGLDGGDKPIRLYRSADQVFRKETLDSFENQTATDDHPPEDISAENWHVFAKGEVKNVARDGEYTGAQLICKAADLISKVRDGKVQISCGYAFDLDMTPGVTPEGQAFDGRQLNILGNHVAVVDYGRAGSHVRIADRKPRSHIVKTRIATKDHKISDKLTVPAHVLTIEAEDAVVASVQDLADRHDRAMKDCKDAYDSKHAEMLIHKERADAAEKALRDAAKDDDEDEENDPDDDDEELGENKAKAKKAGDRIAARAAKVAAKLAAKDAEIARLTALTTPAAEEKRAEERANVIADAKPLVGEDFDPKGKTVPQIRQAALDAALKDEGLKGAVTAMLGGIEPAKAKAEDAAKAFDAVVALGGRTTASDSQDFDISRAIVGDGGGSAVTPGLTARDTWIQRNYERSRAVPTASKYERDTANDAARVQDI
jgi:hypothetical protein